MTDEAIDVLPNACGHCGAGLDEDAVRIGVEISGGILFIAADHGACLTEWGLFWDGTTFGHSHDGDTA